MDNLEKCSICNEQLTDFGNKTLKDGVLCRNCVKLASVWLSDEDYAKRSIKDIKKHLKYREDNLKKLEAFKANREVKGKYSLYIDDNDKKFVLSKRKDFIKENADVLDLDDVLEISVYEKKYKDSDGVDVYFEAKLDNDEINTVTLRVNEFPGILTDSDDYKKVSEVAINYLDELMKDMDFKEEV